MESYAWIFDIKQLILGGSDITAGTLTWAISLLSNNPHAMKKTQEELDLHVGTERQVQESDITNLIYLQAIIKENILSLYPTGPLFGPRNALEDCTVAGYHLSAGSRLVVNVWKIKKDPRSWENPSAFVPKRFLESHRHVDVRGQQFKLMPFGSGRRSRPGVSFAYGVGLGYSFDRESWFDHSESNSFGISPQPMSTW